jgi:hypothetical protein
MVIVEQSVHVDDTKQTSPNADFVEVATTIEVSEQNTWIKDVLYSITGKSYGVRRNHK